MTRHGIAMIEMRMQTRIELQFAASVQLQTQPSVLADTLHCSQLAVRRLQPARGRGELHPVSGGERPLLVPIDGYTLLPPWIVASLRAVLQLDGQPVAGSVYALHP